MGNRYVKMPKLNPRGTYHDADAEIAFASGNIDRFIRRRIAMNVPWGVNSRRTAMLELFLPLSPRVIIVKRGENACKASCLRAFKTDAVYGVARRNIDQWESRNGDFLTVWFDALIDDTESQIAKIAEYIGMSVTSAAVSSVDRSLRHYE